MSESAEFAHLYQAIEKSARLLEVPYAHDKVQAVLTAYKDAIPKTPIAFRMGTGARYSSDVDWRFTIPRDHEDPYTVAVTHGLLEPSDHPVFPLYGEVLQRCGIHCYGVDFGVAGGLKKLYINFRPDDMEPLSAFLDIPSMPPSVAENYDFFVQHGMGGPQMPMFAIDYRYRTANLYFGGLTAEPLAPDTVRSIFSRLQLPEPSERLLKLSGRAMGAYATLSWDSSKIERFAFTIPAGDVSELPVPMEPEIQKFLGDVKGEVADDSHRFVYYVAMSSTGEELYKFQSYYRYEPWLRELMTLNGQGRGS